MAIEISGLKRRRALLASACTAAIGAAALLATPAHAIIINNNFTPTQIADTTPNFNGVSQMIIDQRNGFLGLCTATLINPRTVIFAAHCVNENSAGTGFQNPAGYGAKFGGVPIGFGFAANNLPRDANGVLLPTAQSPLRYWLNNNYTTNTSLGFYNANYVTYNPRSTDLGITRNFLQADVAMAALDTPASKIPQWTLMFSPLSTPAGTPGPDGTGYHTTITGYGTNGTSASGQAGIDYRRRTAENVLGALASLDDFEDFIFGSNEKLPQNLYQIDFDDPNRGKSNASRFDFNAFRDNAQTREGITAPGDSGGPLIIDRAFSKPIVVGVLSGGFPRFFNGQQQYSYGATSFFQPLYLFWDWVLANNPYRYVSATAGDGKWTDATHWVNNLDPAYQVLGANGQPVNGLPTTTPPGITGTTPKFGQICFQDTTSSDCLDVATNKETVTNKPIGQVINGAAQVVAPTDMAEAGAVGSHSVSQTAVGADEVQGPAARPATAKVSRDGAQLTAINGASSGLSRDDAELVAIKGSGSNLSRDDALLSVINGVGSIADLGSDAGLARIDGGPAPQAINTTGTPVPIPGLPGTSGFSPNNTDGTPAIGAPARYYDVTLSAAGTTTLDTAITIDRLTIANTAGLNITSAGSLATNIDTTQTGGVLTVNGRYSSAGDYALVAGLLQGNGTVVAPFLTSVAGVIAPGGIGTIGTLTIQGDVIFASGSQLAIDLGPGGTSDRLAVTANPASGNLGVLQLGGSLQLNSVSGYRPRFNDQFTFITASGGVLGNFNTVSGFSGVLFPQLTVSGNSVSLRILARPYASVIDAGSPVQRAYAALLDANRLASGGGMSMLYGELDLLNAVDLRPTLENMAPHTEVTRTSLGRMQQDSLSRLYRERLTAARFGEGAGSLAVIGQPLLLAQADENPGPGTRPTMSDAGQPAMAPGMRLPENMSAFVAAGGLNGDSRPMPSAFSAGYRDQLSGWYIAGGVEARPSPRLTLGAALGYSEAFGQLRGISRVTSGLLEGSVYGSYDIASGLLLGARATVGGVNSITKRAFQANTVVYRLKGSDSSPEESLEFSASKDLGFMRGLTLTPTASIRYAHLEVGPLAETGGDAALAFSKRNFDSLEGRFGGEVRGSFRQGGFTLTPHLNAAYVHDFADGQGNVPAAFFVGSSGFTTFPGAGREKDWGEIGGGVTASTGRFELNLSADANFGRSDLDYQTYRAAIAYRF